MTPQHKKIIIGLAEYYGEEMTESRLQIYAKAIGHLDLEDIQAAATDITRDASIKRLPLAGEIIERIKPRITREDEAKDAASRIFAAIRKFGWSNRESARAFIGELGWAVVERQGGWSHVCQTMRDRDIPIYQAQFRELAKTVQVRALNNNLDQAPQLPRPTAQRPMLSAVVSELADAKQLKKGSGGA